MLVAIFFMINIKQTSNIKKTVNIVTDNTIFSKGIFFYRCLKWSDFFVKLYDFFQRILFIIIALLTTALLLHCQKNLDELYR